MASNSIEQLAAIVVLAHGPAAGTLTALRRIDGLATAASTPIVIVAGTEPGLTAVDRAIDRGFDGVLDHGPEALATTLRRFDGPVAVVLDDVELDDTVLPALLDAHERTGLVAVAPLEATRSGEDVDSARAICVVGTVEQLVDLAHSAAFGPGVETAAPFTVPAGISVRQSGTSQQRLTEPSALGRPLLVAALIVKNESDQLAACLESLHGIVDRIEVADTGSLDDTVEIARAAGANVREIGWRDDFAWARNQVLERCTDAAYMLWIDADERLVCDEPTRLRRVLATNARLHTGYRFTIHNQNAAGERTHSFIARRIVDPNLVRFEGAVHEQPVRLDGAKLHDAMLAGISIEHYGYEDAIVAQRNKADRNLRIAREAHTADPTGTSALHLARALGAASTDPTETLDELTDLAPIILEQSDPAKALFHSLRAELELRANDPDAAIGNATTALDLIPADATAGAVLAEALTRSGRYSDVVATAVDYASRPSPTPLVDDQLARRTRARVVFESAIHCELFAVAVDQIGDLPVDLDPWSALGTAGGLEVLMDHRSVALDRADMRFLRAVATRPELTAADLERCRRDFGPIDDDELEALLAQVTDRLVDIDAAPAALAQFEESQTLEDAVAHARLLTTNQIDLTLELDDLSSSPHAVAAALAVAAEAQRRRGRTEDARELAERALSHHAASGRAVEIVADQLLVDDPKTALELIDAARQDAAFGTTAPPVRRNIAETRTQALLRSGELRAAVSSAVDILDLGGQITTWDEFLDAAGTDLEAMSPVLGLVLLTDGVSFVDALPQAVGPERTAVICATYLGMGGANPEAVSVGVLAAAMTGQIELGSMIAGHAHLLPAEIIVKLTEHLDRTDTAPIAAALTAPQRLSA